MQLTFITKYFKQIIMFVLAVVLLFLAYKVFKKVNGASNTVIDVLTDNAENKALSTSTGLSSGKIAQLRKDAHKLAFDLQTIKGMSFFDKAKNFHIQFDADTLKCFRNVDSAAAMKVFKAIYENELTESTLIDDLTNTLSASNLSALKFVEQLY